MSGPAFFRLKKLKGSGIIATAARHNKRVIQAELGAAGHIDPARTHLNESLQGPPSADEVAALAKELMQAVGIDKPRKDAVMGLELVFSLPPTHQLDDRAYFADCANWAASQFGGSQNILSVDVHRDEAAPHCHVLLLPLVNKRMVGSDLVGNRQKMLEMQKRFHIEVAAGYGLKKAPARLSGSVKDAAASAVLKRLKADADPALRSSVWAVLRDAIERDPGAFAAALGIEMAAPKKRLRTMTQIFISKGKGPAREPNPIEFQSPPKTQTLCSVGFAPKPPPPTPPIPESEPMIHEVERVRDDDLDPSLFDPETGEFFKPKKKPERAARAAADAWVTAALNDRLRAKNAAEQD